MTPQLIASFEAGTLPRAEWTHEAHVYTAWTYLAREPFAAALARIRVNIRRFNGMQTPPGRYRETVSVAFLTVIADRMRRLGQTTERIGLADSDDAWTAFRCANLDLIGKAPVLERYYSHELLLSEQAADAFVEPDREPLPAIED